MGELLGVAGTDVPIAEIVKLVPAHMVRGVLEGVDNTVHVQGLKITKKSLHHF